MYFFLAMRIATQKAFANSGQLYYYISRFDRIPICNKGIFTMFIYINVVQLWSHCIRFEHSSIIDKLVLIKSNLELYIKKYF